jgi:hypothetical protein
MKKGDYESLLPPKEGSWTLTNLLSLQQQKIKMVMKNAFANPLNGEVDCSMKWCQSDLVKDVVLKTI